MGTLRYCRAVHLTSWHLHAFLHTSELSTTCTLKWILLGPLVHWKKKKMPLYSSTRAMNALPWRWSDFTILSHPFVWGSLLPFLLLSLPLSQSRQAKLLPSRAHCKKRDPMTHTGLWGECCRWYTLHQTQTLWYTDVMLDSRKDIKTLILFCSICTVSIHCSLQFSTATFWTNQRFYWIKVSSNGWFKGITSVLFATAFSK